METITEKKTKKIFHVYVLYQNKTYKIIASSPELLEYSKKFYPSDKVWLFAENDAVEVQFKDVSLAPQ